MPKPSVLAVCIGHAPGQGSSPASIDYWRAYDEDAFGPDASPESREPVIMSVEEGNIVFADVVMEPMNGSGIWHGQMKGVDLYLVPLSRQKLPGGVRGSGFRAILWQHAPPDLAAPGGEFLARPMKAVVAELLRTGGRPPVAAQARARPTGRTFSAAE